MTLEIGATAEAALVVRDSDTAAALAIAADDSFPPVFATSRMIALMELAAARVLRPSLKHDGDGEHSRASVTTARLVAGAAKRKR